MVDANLMILINVYVLYLNVFLPKQINLCILQASLVEEMVPFGGLDRVQELTCVSVLACCLDDIHAQFLLSNQSYKAIETITPTTESSTSGIRKRASSGKDDLPEIWIVLMTYTRFKELWTIIHCWLIMFWPILIIKLSYYKTYLIMLDGIERHGWMTLADWWKYQKSIEESK